MTLVEFVRLLEIGGQVVESNLQDPCIQWAVVELADKRRLLLVERTYREGATTIVDPTDEEIARFRTDPWTAWNSARRDDETLPRLAQ